jgi:PAS domain S-box-containing protein
MAKQTVKSPTTKTRGTTIRSQDSARLEALFASIGEGIIATDEQGMVTRVNQAALDLLGMSRLQVLHKPFLSIIVSVHDNGSPVSAYDRPIVKAFQTGTRVNARTMYVRGDGSFIPVQVTVSPIILRGRPIGAIEVFRDLTDEIENDRLKSDFISIASHQLRTPLSAINMYTRMLRDGLAGEVSEQQLPYLDTVLGSVERMNTLIDTLLNITRIEAGGITIKPRLVRLNILTQEVLAEFLPAAAAKTITLTSSIPDTIKPMITDNLLVKEVCANLLSNAIKYTPDGGTVRFELSETSKDVRWTVSDTGYGIPLSDQKNIFLKFFRAGNITTKDVSGTGLGLYLIKSIAESLDGELWFESTENKGSTFYLSLPRRPLTEEVPA